MKGCPRRNESAAGYFGASYHEQQHLAELAEEQRALKERLATAEADQESSGREIERLEKALADAAEASQRALAEQQARLDARLSRF